MSKVRDRFETALRLSAQAEGVHLRNAKEEMRPRSRREIEDVEWQSASRRSWVGEECAEEIIVLAFCRILGKTGYPPATDLDREILRLSDDSAIARLVGHPGNQQRLRELRDLLPSVRS